MEIVVGDCGKLLCDGHIIGASDWRRASMTEQGIQLPFAFARWWGFVVPCLSLGCFFCYFLIVKGKLIVCGHQTAEREFGTTNWCWKVGLNCALKELTSFLKKINEDDLNNASGGKKFHRK